MKYKLISCDLDGTLLDDNKEISINTIKKINDLINEGYIFVIATGRPYTGTIRYLKLFSNDNPVILYNGSVIKINNETISFSLSDESAKRIIDLINSKNGTYIYWKDEVPYVNRIDDYINDYVKISKVMPKIDNRDYHNVTKIIWFNEHNELLKYEKELFNDILDINHFTSQPTYLEFVSNKASKGKALKYICDKLNIKKENVIAFGDGNNDIEMLKYAGLGIAMENASENVKDNAKYITKSNNDEGVLLALNEILK